MSEYRGNIRWLETANRFQDITTGRFVARRIAAQEMEVSQGAFRDAEDRIVPAAAWGIMGVTQSPFAGNKLTQITQPIGTDPETFDVTRRDVLDAIVSYRYKGGPERTVNISLPKGFAYDPLLAEDYIAGGVARMEVGDSRADIDYWDDVEVTDVEWNARSFYYEGEVLGEDYYRFTGYEMVF